MPARKKRMGRRQVRQNAGGLRVAAYIRVSTTRQSVEGDSLEAQQNDIRKSVDYKTSMGKWSVGTIEYYVDAGRSAKDQNRPELQRLKQDIKAGKIDTVVVVKLDRLTRSLLDFVELWDLFGAHHVQLLSLREEFDTSQPMGEAMLKLIMVFAELERKLTAERTLATMEDRTERGLWNGGCIYGYESDPSDPGRLIVDKEWAQIIQTYFFDAFEKLGSVGAVQRQLRTTGIRVPEWTTKHGKPKGGDYFAKQQVSRILRNRIYLGEMHWGEIVNKESHEPIIDRRQFDRVQRKLDETTRTRTNHRHSDGRCYILRGLIRCGCGAMMTPKSAHGRSGKYHYYTCTRQNHHGQKTDCQAPMIPAEALEEAILERLIRIGVNVGDRQKIADAALREIDGEGRKLASQIDIARHRLTRVQAEVKNLLEVLKTLGKSGIASVGTELRELEVEREKLQAEITMMVEQESPLKRTSDAAREFIENWTDIRELLAEAEPDEKRCIVHHFIQSLELRFADMEEKRAEYALALFPEVRPERIGPGNKNGTVAEIDDRPSVLTQKAMVRQVVEKAPRGGLSSHRGFVELGSYATNKLRQTPIIELYAWTRPPASQTRETKPPEQKRDPLRIARYYQSLLDSGKFENRAALARHLGVSRARVTQVLNRLKDVDEGEARSA